MVLGWGIPPALLADGIFCSRETDGSLTRNVLENETNAEIIGSIIQAWGVDSFYNDCRMGGVKRTVREAESIGV